MYALQYLAATNGCWFYYSCLERAVIVFNILSLGQIEIWMASFSIDAILGTSHQKLENSDLSSEQNVDYDTKTKDDGRRKSTLVTGFIYWLVWSCPVKNEKSFI